MPKPSVIYVCENCDAQFPKWSGRCLSCGKWGMLKEAAPAPGASRNGSSDRTAAEIIDFKDISRRELPRMITGIVEADRVLGGGIMPGSLILLSGEPGIGKSTIVAQIAGALAKSGEVLYISGEESAFQVKSRFNRLEIDTDRISFIGETLIDRILPAITKTAPSLVIVDSIQTVYTDELESEAGGISQIRACAVKLLEVAKDKDIPMIIVGHVTKDGQLAGPKSLEHIADTVIYLETERTSDFRILRAVKNRFGSVNELGIFEMTGAGFREVKNPSSVFLEISGGDLSGSVISCLIEGTRPFLVEAQALVTKAVFGYPQRKASGFDLNRLNMLSSVMSKRTKFNLMNQDVLINVIGGFKINDPALDLAVCLAIASSGRNSPVSRKTIALGEVGLGGEVRNVKMLEQRLAEAEKLGFEKAIVPDAKVNSKNIKLLKISKIEDLEKLS